jgi:undecaprenyl diphosphate synthase
MPSKSTFITIPDSLLPNHVGFIIDGNRRWAKENNRSIFDGHTQGIENVKQTIQNCIDLNIKNITFFALSIENWKRNETEISNLMKIFKNAFDDKDFLENKNANLRFIGNLSMLPKELQIKTQKINARESQIDAKIDVNIAISYSGQDEIIRAHEKAKKENLSLVECLDLKNKLPIDLIIRTGGEHRISNFMLWDMAYSELFFTPKKWPDFDYHALCEAITWYINRNRRYGI